MFLLTCRLLVYYLEQTWFPRKPCVDKIVFRKLRFSSHHDAGTRIDPTFRWEAGSRCSPASDQRPVERQEVTAHRLLTSVPSRGKKSLLTGFWPASRREARGGCSPASYFVEQHNVVGIWISSKWRSRYDTVIIIFQRHIALFNLYSIMYSLQQYLLFATILQWLKAIIEYTGKNMTWNKRVSVSRHFRWSICSHTSTCA